MRTALEALMYLAFSLAALPMAWLGVSEILFYRSHPDQLADRARRGEPTRIRP